MREALAYEQETDAHLGAINDLTIATEFLMGAIRDIARGHGPESEGVAEQVDWAMRKIAGVAKVPI